MNKFMAFAVAVIIAVFVPSLNTAATEPTIQDNHDQHHKATKTSVKSDKGIAVKRKKRAASKKRATRPKKSRGIARKAKER